MEENLLRKNGAKFKFIFPKTLVIIKRINIKPAVNLKILGKVNIDKAEGIFSLFLMF